MIGNVIEFALLTWVLIALGVVVFCLVAGKIFDLFSDVETALPPDRPLRIQLKPVLNGSETSIEPAEPLQSLQEAGFLDAGRWQAESMPDTFIHLLVHPDTNTIAEIINTTGRVHLELMREFNDGISLTLSTAKEKFSLPRPPSQPVRFVHDLPPTDLHQRLLSHRPEVPTCPVSVETAPNAVERGHAREQDWLAERSGYTYDELRAALVASGKQVDDTFIIVMREKHADLALSHWWQLQPDPPAPWHDVQGEILIVHDGLSRNSVEWLYRQSLGQWETDARLTPASATSSREAFEFLNQTDNCPFVRIWQKKTPLAADFYLPATTQLLAAEAQQAA
jgi:hypothetical protein